MNIASMTGFARINENLQTEDKNFSYLWEVKSVNAKNLDVKLKLPTGYEDIAIDLRKIAEKYLNRGSVSAYLEIKAEDKNKDIKVDEELLNKLAEIALGLKEKYGEKIMMPSVSDLMMQKGVIEYQESELNEEQEKYLKQNLLQGFEKLCKNLQENRQVEGQKIKQALMILLENISEIVNNIENFAKVLPQELKEKLQNQIKEFELENEVSEERIAQELVLLVTKADIREETDRLKAHIKACKELLESNEPVGRRLDFLCQELNREANTTCSKAADIKITNWGMELKAEIEKFREQVQNIE